MCYQPDRCPTPSTQIRFVRHGMLQQNINCDVLKRHFCVGQVALLAQMAEHVAFNHRVTGSIPV